MDCKIKHEKDFSVVSISGTVERVPDCDLLNIDINKLIDAEIPHVMVDLTKTTFVSSSLCGLLVSCQKRATGRTKISVVVPHEGAVGEIFKKLGLDKIMDVQLAE